MNKVISWAITEGCNATPPCHYCIAKVKPLNKNNHPNEENIINIVNGINRLSPSKIFINGGEPFAVPNFLNEVVLGLTQKDNNLFITSNFISPIEDYVKLFELAKGNLIALNLSYHLHLFPNYSHFVNKIQRLVDIIGDKSKIIVSTVLTPTALETIVKLEAELKTKLGIEIYPQYYKVHNESGQREYYHYTASQNEIVDIFSERKKRSYPMETKNRECQAGRKYVFIDSMGSVFRCQMYSEKGTNNNIGNIMEDSFKLVKEAIKCDFDYCSCGSAQNSNLLMAK